MKTRNRFINVMTVAALVLALGSALLSVKIALAFERGATYQLTNPCEQVDQEPS